MRLVEDIGEMTVEFAATTIALSGHYLERALAERAAALARDRCLSPDEVVRIADGAAMGMRHVFDMDLGLGGALRPMAPHPGLAAWTEVGEDWAGRSDLPSPA